MQYGILVAGLTGSLAITVLAIPSIVKVARSKGLYGDSRNGGRKEGKVPTLGGLAVFAGIIIPFSMMAGPEDLPQLPHIIAGALVLFFIGVKDDILVTAPWWKLAGQVMVAFAVSAIGGLRIPVEAILPGVDLEGEWIGILFTMLAMVTLINSYNLVDGIDGLAAGTGLIATMMFGLVFIRAGMQEWTLVAAVMAGSLAGFARYNVFSGKNKIYMGDTGSLIAGFFISLMAVRFLSLETEPSNGWQSEVPLSFVIAVMVVPVFDIFRIVFLRISQGRSPFRPDRQHIHYRLVDLGLSHLQATGTLLAYTLLMLSVCFFLRQLGDLLCVIVLFALASLSSLALRLLQSKKKSLG